MRSATRFRYEIEADADTDALVRITNQLNFANTAPWALMLATTGECLTVDVELRDITETLADYIRRKLLQQTCVIGMNK